MHRLIPSLLMGALLLNSAGADTANPALAALTEQQVCTGEGVNVETSLPVSNLLLQSASETTLGVAYQHRDALNLFNATCLVRTHLSIQIDQQGKELTYTVRLDLVQDKRVLWSASTVGTGSDLADLEARLSDLVEIDFQQLITEWKASH